MTTTVSTTARGILALLFAFMLCLVPAGVNAQQQQQSVVLSALHDTPGSFYMMDPVDGASPVTLQTRFEFTSQESLDALQGMWIAGFSTSPDTAPSALALVWSEDRSGWFPVWGLQLQSDGDLFTKEHSAKSGTGILADSAYIAAHSASPQVGHVYQAEISYDPQTGSVAVGMTDLTTETRLFSRSWLLNPAETDAPLYPAIGLIGDARDVRIESVMVFPYTVPLGADWDLAFLEAGRYSRLALFRFTPDYELALRLDPKTPHLAGSFALSVAGDEQPIVEYRPQADAQETFLPFSAADLPYGEFTLRLDYVDETGRRWNFGSRSLVMVAATVDINFGPLSIEDDMLHGTLTLTSQDETVDDVSLRVLAAVGEPDPKNPGPYNVVAENHLQTISQTPLVIPFVIPLDVDGRLFSVVLDVEFDLPMGKVMHGNRYHVLLDRS